MSTNEDRERSEKRELTPGTQAREAEDQVKGDTAKIPLGHPIASHELLGWCSFCPGRTVIEEVDAWRVWAMQLLPKYAPADRLTQHAVLTATRAAALARAQQPREDAS